MSTTWPYAIADLPDGYRLLITLRHLQEMTYNEIAAVTDMPLGTVKTGIFRARRMLRINDGIRFLMASRHPDRRGRL